MEDRHERLADAERAFTGVGEGDLAAFVRDGFVAGEDLLHDRDVVADAPVRLAPRLSVPALDDLGSRDAESEDEATTAGHRIDGLGGHRGSGGGAGGELDDAGAEPDALGLGGDVGEWRDGVRAVGFGGPDGVVTELFGLLDHVHGDRHLGA